MIATTYQNASEFLLKTQETLEKKESANNLMLGICFRLKRFPERIKAKPYFITVDDENELVVAAIMTPPHKIILYSDRADYGSALEIIVKNLIANDWVVPGVLGPSHVAKEFAVTWANFSGTQYKEGTCQRVYELKKVIHSELSRGKLRVATEGDAELMTQWVFDFQREALTGSDIAEAQERAKSRISDRDIYVWEDGKPVSMAAKSRPTSNGIVVNLVYTPPELRRRGYATSCVANLSQLLLDSGRKFCALFTDLSNPTSNHIYQKIGYTPVCDFNEYIFRTVM